LSGASFESADDETLNNWHERLNVTWRNIATPNVSLWTHLVRRRDISQLASVTGSGFADRLARRYQARLATETLMVNEIYLTVLFRPITGAAPTLVSRFLSKREAPSARTERGNALEACAKLRQTVAASLARYEPELLGVYAQGGDATPRFWSSGLSGQRRMAALCLASGAALGSSGDQPRALRQRDDRVPDAYSDSIRRRARDQGVSDADVVGMYDALLSAPFAFVLTQSFTFLSKASGQGLLQRQHARMANAGDFAVSQAEELIDALDALTSNDFVMGDHHFTLLVLADAPVGAPSEEQPFGPLNDHVALARALLADTGMTVAREDLGLEAAFWAQLPGNFSDRPRKAPITSRNFAAMVSFHNYPCGRATGNHWGDALALLMTSSRSPYYFSLHATDPKDPDGGSRKDTGHTFVCGPTGSGKTVFVGFMLAMLARQDVTQVVFDKDRGLEILVRALGGTYLPLKNGAPTGFNPLQLAADALRTWNF
jgi:type IV secretion system protein VirB4